MNKGMVSIVIPIVKNDIHVAGCVKAIEDSTYKNVEIIVVDEGLERSAQRNIGIKRATGEYLLWLDSDMRVHPEVIEDCAYKMSYSSEPAGVYIPETIVTEGWFGKLRNWERQFYNGTLVDVVRFVRTEECPLFDEEMHGVEDSDWERRLEGRKVVCDHPVYHHDKVGVIKWLKKKAYYARCLNLYKRKNPNDRLITFRYRCVQLFIEKGKWKRLVRRPHYALAVALLLLARGLIFMYAIRKYK